jgi:hypothetical protein
MLVVAENFDTLKLCNLETFPSALSAIAFVHDSGSDL